MEDLWWMMPYCKWQKFGKLAWKVGWQMRIGEFTTHVKLASICQKSNACQTFVIYGNIKIDLYNLSHHYIVVKFAQRSKSLKGVSPCGASASAVLVLRGSTSSTTPLNISWYVHDIIIIVIWWTTWDNVCPKSHYHVFLNWHTFKNYRQWQFSLLSS